MLGPLAWVLIYTADLAGMRHFYGQLLGLREKKANEAVVAYDAGGCILELMGRLDNGPEALDDSRGWARNKVLISFHVDDIEAEVARLQALGVPFVTGIRPTVSPPGQPPRGRIAQFMDPDGNLLELGQMPLG